MDYQTYVAKRQEMLAQMEKIGMTRPGETFPKMRNTQRLTNGESWTFQDQLDAMDDTISGWDYPTKKNG